MDVENISNTILKAIEKDRRFGSQIIQKQKTTWLKFSTPVPSNLHKPITKKLKQKREVIKWLSDTEIKIKLL